MNRLFLCMALLACSPEPTSSVAPSPSHEEMERERVLSDFYRRLYEISRMMNPDEPFTGECTPGDVDPYCEVQVETPEGTCKGHGRRLCTSRGEWETCRGECRLRFDSMGTCAGTLAIYKRTCEVTGQGATCSDRKEWEPISECCPGDARLCTATCSVSWDGWCTISGRQTCYAGSWTACSGTCSFSRTVVTGPYTSERRTYQCRM